MDLILGPFAEAHFERLEPAELARFETLFDEADTDLLKWVTGQEAPPVHIDQSLLDRLIAFRQANIAS